MSNRNLAPKKTYKATDEGRTPSVKSEFSRLDKNEVRRCDNHPDDSISHPPNDDVERPDAKKLKSCMKKPLHGRRNSKQAGYGSSHVQWNEYAETFLFKKAEPTTRYIYAREKIAAADDSQSCSPEENPTSSLSFRQCRIKFNTQK